MLPNSKQNYGSAFHSGSISTTAVPIMLNLILCLRAFLGVKNEMTGEHVFLITTGYTDKIVYQIIF